VTVIERWTVYVDPSYDGKPVRQPSPREADRFGFEAVEVVPADQLQGAVEDLREAAALLADASFVHYQPPVRGDKARRARALSDKWGQ
jgi:hypothetical protein